MTHHNDEAGPAPLLLAHAPHLTSGQLPGPVLDLACGSGRNGMYIAEKGLPVVFCDRSASSLARVKRAADRAGVNVTLWRVDLEQTGMDPLAPHRFGAILVFRYLHRPLIPHIRQALLPGGILIYETFTHQQPRFGKPRNPDYLLVPGELKSWFGDWHVLHDFEGILSEPRRALAQIVCRKPDPSD